MQVSSVGKTMVQEAHYRPDVEHSIVNLVKVKEAVLRGRLGVVFSTETRLG